MKIWTGSKWIEWFEPPRVVGYGHAPIEVTAAELEHAKANPLNLTQSMLARQHDDDFTSELVRELRCPRGHGLNCNCEAARAQRFEVNANVAATNRKRASDGDD